jgi:hypothetical protein
LRYCRINRRLFLAPALSMDAVNNGLLTRF